MEQPAYLSSRCIRRLLPAVLLMLSVALSGCLPGTPGDDNPPPQPLVTRRSFTRSSHPVAVPLDPLNSKPGSKDKPEEKPQTPAYKEQLLPSDEAKWTEEERSLFYLRRDKANPNLVMPDLKLGKNEKDPQLSLLREELERIWKMLSGSDNSNRTATEYRYELKHIGPLLTLHIHARLLPADTEDGETKILEFGRTLHLRERKVLHLSDIGKYDKRYSVNLLLPEYLYTQCGVLIEAIESPIPYGTTQALPYDSQFSNFVSVFQKEFKELTLDVLYHGSYLETRLPYYALSREEKLIRPTTGWIPFFPSVAETLAAYSPEDASFAAVYRPEALLPGEFATQLRSLKHISACPPGSKPETVWIVNGRKPMHYRVEEGSWVNKGDGDRSFRVSRVLAEGDLPPSGSFVLEIVKPRTMPGYRLCARYPGDEIHSGGYERTEYFLQPDEEAYSDPVLRYLDASPIQGE